MLKFAANLFPIGTSVKELNLSCVVITTPCGGEHREETDLEHVAAALREKGFDFKYAGTDTIEITKVPANAA